MVKINRKSTTAPRFALVNLSDVSRSGNLSAIWHVNQAKGKYPYMINAEYAGLREAESSEWHYERCLWLTSSEKEAFLKQLEKLHKAYKQLEKLRKDILKRSGT